MNLQSFLVLLLLATGILQGQQLLTSFETGDDGNIVTPSGVRAERITDHATHGKFALKVVFPGSDTDTWPGIVVTPPEQDLSAYDVLAFDVHNAQDHPVHLSWRIDDAHGKKEFGGGTVKAGTTDTLQLYIAALKSKLDITCIARIYPYIRMPRKDVILTFDHFRFTTFQDTFTGMTYRHSGPTATPTIQDRQRGYQLYSRHWMDVVFPESRPRPGEEARQLQTFACPGETEPLTLELLALRDLANARVTVTNLQGPDEFIQADAVRVYPVRCLDKRTTYSSKTYIKDMPVLLEKRSAVDIKAGDSKRFWLDVNVPQDLPAGIYQGEAIVQAGNAPDARVPLRIRVLPLSLPEPEGAILGEYYRGPALAKTEDEQRAFLLRDLRDMRTHGMTSVGLCFGYPHKQATLNDDGVDLVFDGSSLFEHFMLTYRKLAFPAPVVILSDSGQAFASAQGFPFGSTQYDQAYVAFWTAMQQACRERDWPELIVQPVDEPGWKDEQARARNVHLLKLLKTIPGMRTEQDGPGDGYFHHQAGPYADIWNYNGALAKQDVLEKAKRAKHLIMIYNCDVESYRPEIGRYTAGFFQKRAGIHGYYNWAYTSFSGSPYNDFDYKTGTWMHVYPPYEDEVGGPSTGWQGYREGVDDYRYMQCLEDQIRTARRSGNPDVAALAQKAGDALADILHSLDYSPRVRNAARWTQTKCENGKTIIGGTLKIPNGWDFTSYDVARWQIAALAMDLKQAVTEGQAVADAGTKPEPDSQVDCLGPFEAHPADNKKALPQQAAQHVTITETEQAPVIDGAINEEAWQNAAHIPTFRLAEGGVPQANTEAWLMTDGKSLFIACRCEEPFMDQITAEVTEDGGPVWKDDCVEVFFDPESEQTEWRQIAVNSLGTLLTASSGEERWTPKVQRATTSGDDAWSVEMSIPLRDLALSKAIFGLNICRERRPTEVLELSCWSPTGGRFARPDRFGTASIGGSYLQNATLGDVALGLNVFRTLVALPHGQKKKQARLAFSWEPGPDQARQQTSIPITLEPGEAIPLEVPFTIDAGGGRVVADAALLATPGDEVLAKRRLSMEIPHAVTVDITPKIVFADGSPGLVTVETSVKEDLRKSAQVRITVRPAGADEPVLSRVVSIPASGKTSARFLPQTLPAGANVILAEVIDSETKDVLAAAQTRAQIVAGPFAGK